ncbi:hypothetical protein GCM10018954_100340 [Kutzneria kofuensis]
MLPVGTGHRLAGWALVVADWTADQHDVAVELATLIGLERSALAAGRVVERRAATQLLSLLADESTPAADISARLTAAGFGAEDRLCVVSMTITGEPGLALDVLDELVDGLVAEVDGEAVAITLFGNDLLESLRSGVRAIEPGLGPCRLALGVSGPGPGSRLRASIDEARYARGVAGHNANGNGGVRAAVVAGSELASHQLLFGALPDELRQSFCRRLLGPVRPTTGSTTPSCWSRCGCSSTAPARGARPPPGCTCTSTPCVTASAGSRSSPAVTSPASPTASTCSWPWSCPARGRRSGPAPPTPPTPR